MASKPTAEEVARAQAWVDGHEHVADRNAANVARVLLHALAEVAVLRAYIAADHAIRMAQDDETSSAEYRRAFDASTAARKALDAFDRGDAGTGGG